MLPLADAALALHDILRCPACRGPVTIAPRVVGCAVCRTDWPRPHEALLDLRLPAWNAAANRWRDRQAETCKYYDELKTAPDVAGPAFRSDLGPFADSFSAYRGRVLDVGGGNGIVRAFLPAAEYVSLDPSTEWLSEDWNALADEFSCLNEPLVFVQGFAERLPFADASFDAALCLWTLNHCADPTAALHEVARVVRRGGRFLLVLEDGEPTLAEIFSGSAAHYVIGSGRLPLLKASLTKPFTGWPVQSDHIAISNATLERATSGAFRQLRRWWVGCYLSLEYEKGW